MACKQETEMTVLSLDDCSVVQVTVFKDKAQVTRQVEVELKKGRQEVKISGFMDLLKASAVKVVAPGGVTIKEVKVQDVDVTELNKKYKQLRYEDDMEDQRIEDLQFSEKSSFMDTEMKLMSEFFNTAARLGISREDGDETKPVSPDSYIKGVREFLKEFRDLQFSLMADKVAYQRQQDKEERIENEIRFQYRACETELSNAKVTKECLVTLESPEDKTIVLSFSYFLGQVMWLPSYDLHMSTGDGVLKLIYYGVVYQNTHHAWKDAKIFLSTEEPICYKDLPDKPKLRLCHSSEKNTTDEDDNYRRYRYDHEKNPKPEIKDKSSCMTFEVPDKCTIPCDDQPYKVKVAEVDFTPDVLYKATPRAHQGALLKAFMANSSPFLLMAGATNYFIDDTFVHSGSLPTVGQEKFDCCMGVDPNVVVTYKPYVKTTTISEDGVTATDQFEQGIQVQNLHDHEIKVSLQENLPESGNDDIKVTLVSPTESDPDVDVQGDQITWDLTISPKETGQAVLTYTAQRPANVDVAFKI